MIKARCVNEKKEIFDPIRRCFVALTDEELVRQAYLKYLQEQLFVPTIAISVEKKITYNGRSKRYDIVVAAPDGSILILVECKAENVKINDLTLVQTAIYNSKLQSKYISLFNGKEQFVYQKFPEGYLPIDELPDYNKMIIDTK